MKPGPMRSWLRLLVLVAALTGGLPSVAWAHAGHDHGALSSQSSQQRPVWTVVDSIIRTIHIEHVLDSTHSVLQSLTVVVGTHSSSHTYAGGSSGDWRAYSAVVVPAEVPDQPLGQHDCCCGGVACHAGMDIPAQGATRLFIASKRVDLSPVSTIAGLIPAGIERPPRPGTPH